MRRSLALLTLLSASVVPLAAHASTLTGTITSFASGSVSDGVTTTTFTNKAITITGDYDPASVDFVAGVVYQAPTTLTYTIAGLGSFTAATAASDYFYLVPSGAEAGVGNNANSTFFSVGGPFSSYDLSTPFSLIGTETGFNGTRTDAVSQGMNAYNLTLTDDTAAATFSIAAQSAGTGPSPVPEPSSLMLLSTGILGMAGAARRRFSRS